MAYTDADWAGDDLDRKSTSGFCLFVLGNAVGWRTLKQSCIATSTTEAEYVSLCECLKVVKWARKLLREICMLDPAVPSTVYEDNTGVLDWSHGTRRAKHIELKYHFVVQAIESGEAILKYCTTDAMLADIFTKALSVDRFRRLSTKFGLIRSNNGMGRVMRNTQS